MNEQNHAPNGGFVTKQIVSSGEQESIVSGLCGGKATLVATLPEHPKHSV
jgi:hypothetical protein